MKGWTIISDKQPDLKKLVLVWRSKKRKYVVASMDVFCPDIDDLPEDSPPYKKLRWITKHGIAHDVHINDRWLEFPLIKITENISYEEEQCK